MASVRPVVPAGAPVGLSSVREGVVVALKMARADDPLSVEALGREVEVFEALCRAPGEPPCPRLFDVVGSPVCGLVMEWCPSDLERWWADRCGEPAAFGELCSTLAEVCRRVREYAAVAEMELGRRVIHADIKPRNVLLSESGRWLLTDFGASKSRSVDDANWAATKMILGTENYIAPEALFNARKPHPAAADTWSLGCTFFALLRMRVLLRGGGKLPPNGTHAHHFRTHRAALVADVHLRRPNAFADRELDASSFPSPDRLPERDRDAVIEAVAGTLGNQRLEARLANDAINLLDRALQVDPARRYVDALEMAGDFEALAIRWRELAVRVDGGPTGPRNSAPAISAPAPSAPAERAEPRRGAAGGWVKGLVAGVVLAGLAGVAILGCLGLGWVAYVSTQAAKVPAAPAPTPAEAQAILAEPPPVDPGLPATPPEATTSPASRTPASPAITGEPAVVMVFGAEAYLLGGGKRRSPGTIPAGSYELFAATGEGGGFVSHGRFSVEPGEELTWRCGFGKCRLAD